MQGPIWVVGGLALLAVVLGAVFSGQYFITEKVLSGVDTRLTSLEKVIEAQRVSVEAQLAAQKEVEAVLFASVDARLDKVDTRLDKVDTRLDKFGTPLEEVLKQTRSD
jgi:hypothetical protein